MPAKPTAAAGPQVRSSRRTARVVFAAVAAVTALIAVGCSTASSAASGTSGTSGGAAGNVAAGQYVALGDSYTAAPGVGSPIGEPAGCERSSGSYPMLVAQRLKLRQDQVLDVSCYGATISNLSGPQGTGHGTNPPQLTALSAATTLVTLGIGGNDFRWSDQISQCQQLDFNASGPYDGPCQAYFTSGGVNQLQQLIQQVAGNLASALTQIRHLAPHARVYVVGYPDLMPSSGIPCAEAFGLTVSDMAFLNTAGQYFNAMERQQAAAAGATYVDVYTPSVGHDACATPAQRWISPLQAAVPLHPTPLGEQGMADAVLRAITAAGK